MNAKLILLAVAVAVIGAGALMMCDDSDAAAGDVLASGSCGTSLTYEVKSLNADNSQVELGVSGSGDMANWNYNSVPWGPYHAQIMSVTLPSGLTSLGDYAFFECSRIKSIDLPTGITSIGKNVFSRCTGLTNIDLPSGLTSLGDYAFAYSAIQDIVIPVGITRIGDGTFNSCSALNNINLPAGITSIGSNAFMTCFQLNTIELPAGITSIGSNTFSTYIKNITMPYLVLKANTGLSGLTTITYITPGVDMASSDATFAPQYLSRESMRSITFANDYIPAFALYGQNLDRLTITKASGDDFLGIYTAPAVKATASALTVDGTAAHVVRITDTAGAAELTKGSITANDVNIHWDTSPHGYATGEVDASPEVLVYPAGIHTSAPNQYAGLINAIPLIVIVTIITTIIGMMAVRRD